MTILSVKKLDKKSIVLLSVLLVIAVVVIVVSQTLFDKSGGNKFGENSYSVTSITETTSSVITETTAAPETTTETTVATTEEIASSDAVETETYTSEADTTEEDITKSLTVQQPSSVSVYGSFELDNALLTITDDDKYRLSNKAGDATFSGNIRNVKSGDELPISNRKLKKLGLNPKQVNKEKMFYVQLQYDKHEFVKDGQTITCYYNSNIHAKKDSFNILIYYNEDNIPCVYDLNGDISNIDFTNYYF